MSEQPEEPKSLAQRCLEEAEGDAKAAMRLMASEVRADPDLASRLTDRFVETACFAEIRQILRTEREHIWHSRNYDPGQGAGRVVQLAEGNNKMLLDFRLPVAGMPRLRDALGSQVEEARHYYKTHAKDMAGKARWLHRIRNRVPRDEPVVAHLDEETLQKLRSEAK